METKTINGGNQWLGFARSRVAALNAIGIPNASQRFEMPDGAEVHVKISQGRKFIEINSALSCVSSFGDVQNPEPDTQRLAILKSLAKVRLGSYPAEVIKPEWNGIYPAVARGRTHFAVSPFSKNNLRMTRRVLQDRPYVQEPPPIGMRNGGDGTFHHTIFSDGVVQEVIAMSNPTTFNPLLGSLYENRNYIARTRNNQFFLLTNSSKRAVLATLESEADFKRTAVRLPPVAGEYSSATDDKTSHIGKTYVRLRIHSGGKYRIVDVGELPLNTQTSDVVKSMDDANGLYFKYRTDYAVTNGLAPANPWSNRRWHQMECASVAPGGEAFVLRETSSQTWLRSYQTLTDMQSVNTLVSNYGLQLSFVSPDDKVTNNIFSVQLGRHGYIQGVIPSKDGLHVYVYYGIHQAAADLPEPPDTLAYLPVKYKEYLAVIKITKTDTRYSFALEKTVDLGLVTLSTYIASFNTIGTEHFYSKLNGAALEVEGFIWSDRFCYDVKENVFYEIPFLDVGFNPMAIDTDNFSRNTINTIQSVRSSYLQVALTGLTATYFLVKFGRALFYELKKNVSGVYAVVKKGESPMLTGFSNDEFTGGAAVVRF